METEPESRQSAHENAGPRLPSGVHLVLLVCPHDVGISQMLLTKGRKEILSIRTLTGLQQCPSQQVYLE